MKNTIYILAILLSLSLLPACGGTVNQDAKPDSEEATKALFEAARSGNPDNIAELLKNGADVNSIDEEGRTPLDIAMTKQQWKAARLLYLQGARLQTVDYGNVVEAARVGDIERVRRFLAVGSNVDKRGNGIWTPLHYAAENGDVELVDILIANGADIDAPAGFLLVFPDGGTVILTQDIFRDRRSPLGKTPFHRAVEKDHIQVVRILAENHCEINVTNCRGKTALDFAETEEMKKLLRSYGAVSGEELKGKQEK